MYFLCHLVVISPYKFSICDTTSEVLYSGGGVVLQVKTPTSLTFVSTVSLQLAVIITINVKSCSLCKC